MQPRLRVPERLAQSGPWEGQAWAAAPKADGAPLLTVSGTVQSRDRRLEKNV